MVSILSTRVVAAIIIVILLISGGMGIYYLVQDDPSEDEPEQEDKETVDYSSSLIIKRQRYYKGEPLELEITSTSNTSTSIVEISFEIFDPSRFRYALQTFPTEINITEGSTQVDLEISPAFADEGFVALSFGNYSLTSYRVLLATNQSFSYDVELNIEIIDYPLVDHAGKLVWHEQVVSNVTYSQTADSFNVTTLPGTSGNLILNSTTNLEAFARLIYDSNLSSNDTLTISVGEEEHRISSNNNSHYIGIGNYLSKTSLLLNFTLAENSSLTLTLSLPTRKTVLFAVVASNNWSASSVDNLPFFLPEYYVNQASSRFSSVFNLTILPVSQVNFTSQAGSNLQSLISEAMSTVGNNYSLPNDEWNLETGTQEANAGADILVIMTNKTMDNLGVVVGDYGGAFNAAVNARGSLNTGNYRLHSSLADNLVQHEISHVFGAPDRWTYSDTPSVMTKSTPNDAITDIIFNEFWLFLTNWLEEDIQTMYDHIDLYR